MRMQGVSPVSPVNETAAVAATSARPVNQPERVKMAGGVNVTLTPQARNAISRLESTMVTLGSGGKVAAPPQRPGSRVDLRV